MDPRGPRFGGALTTVVLALALVSFGTAMSTVLQAWQLIVFGLGAFVGLRAQPYGWVFRHLVQPRLAPPTEWEDPAPPRFAQVVGFAFVGVAMVAGLLGADLVAMVALGMALAAAFLNAAFGFCLGCETYLLARRAVARS